MKRKQQANISLSVLLSMVFFASINAATYYVSVKGSDNSPGTSGSPFKSIQKAADVVKPGDKVIVKAGIYKEYIKLRTSGTSSQRIVFEAERGSSGERLAIIDRAEPTSGWTLAPTSVGWKTYMNRNIKFAPFCMVQGTDKDVPKLVGEIGHRTCDPFLNLKKLPNDTITTSYGAYRVCYWDGLGAFYYYDPVRKAVYLRYQHGDNPDTKGIRVAPAGSALSLANVSYVTIKGFLIRGCQVGITIVGSNARHNIIEENHIMNGQTRIIITAGASYNEIRNNKAEMHGITSFERGAWASANNTDKRNYPIWVKGNIYERYKREVGKVGNDVDEDGGIRIEGAGPFNRIHGNEIFDTQAGIYIGTSSNTKIYNNHIHHVDKGVQLNWDMVNVEFNNNLFFDCNHTIRIMSLGDPRPRKAYFYNNKFCNPGVVGQHTYWHWSRPTGTPSIHELYFYHNSFAGGYQALRCNAYHQAHKGTPKCLMVNNVFSSRLLGSSLYDMGAFDYNWVGGSFNTATMVQWWVGKGVILSRGKLLWPYSQIPALPVPANSPIINRGLDLSKPFKAAGKSFPALPGMTSGYYSGSAPNIGAWQGGVSIRRSMAPQAHAVIRLATRNNAIGYRLSAPADVSVQIVNALGQQVFGVSRAHMNEGTHWVSLQKGGRPIAAGIYMVQLTTDSDQATGRFRIFE